MSDTAALQGHIDFSAGGTAHVPAGVHEIDTTLTLPRDTSLVLDDGAVIRAVAPIDGPMLRVGDLDDWWEDRELSGGKWDCNRLAQDGIDVPCALNSRVRDVKVHNQLRHTLILGNTEARRTTHGTRLDKVAAWRDNFDPAQETPADRCTPGSYGIWITKAAPDNMVIDCRIMGPERCFRVDGDGNTFFYAHGWGGNRYMFPKAVFSDNGSDNQWIGCNADTPAPSGWGWEFTAKSWRWRINGGMVFNNDAAHPDGALGIHTELPVPNGECSITGLMFHGESGRTLSTDYDGQFPAPNLAVSGVTHAGVTAPILTDSIDELRVRRTRSYGATPSTSAGSGAGPGAPTPTVTGNDSRGSVSFGTGAAPPNTDMLVWVTFARPFATPPIVRIQPRNLAAQRLGLWVEAVGTRSFGVRATVAPSAAAPVAAFKFDYAADE